MLKFQSNISGPVTFLYPLQAKHHRIHQKPCVMSRRMAKPYTDPAFFCAGIYFKRFPGKTVNGIYRINDKG